MMVFGKRLALAAYQRWTQRERQAIQQFLDATRQWPAAILFYHRVADRCLNDWSISTHDFARHLDWIARHASFVSLDELQQSQRSSVRSKLTIAMTFDDGYADNCDWALPELIRRQIPCTYFVSTGFVKSGEPFPHDVARGQPLRTNSIDQIQQMAKDGVTIGGHTETHLNLGAKWPRHRLLREIYDSRRELQDWSQQPVNHFAFPYGQPENMSQAAIDMVYEAGYQSFVSAYGGWNWLNGDSFHLQRIHGDPGLATLTNWLTLDPRKFRCGRSFQYTRPPIEGTTMINHLDTVTEALAEIVPSIGTSPNETIDSSRCSV